MKTEQLNTFLIFPYSTVVEAMQKIDANAKGILFVTDENRKLFGVITDGDIRRWLIKTGELSGTVEQIMNKNPKMIYRKSCSEFKSTMNSKMMKHYHYH